MEILRRAAFLSLVLGATIAYSRPATVPPGRPGYAAANGLAAAHLAPGYGRLPLAFEANRGQVDGRVRFVARGSEYTVLLTATDALLSVRTPVAQASATSLAPHPTMASVGARSSVAAGDRSRPWSRRQIRWKGEEGIGGTCSRFAACVSSVLRLHAEHANPHARIIGLGRLPGRVSYFIGNDSRRWHTGIEAYARVEYANIYPGVDLVYHGTAPASAPPRLEYDWVVRPGVDPRVIRLSVEGRARPYLDSAGALLLPALGGWLRQARPFAYQQIGNHRSVVPVGYALDGQGRVGFRVGRHDTGRPLVIDPVLVYSTYLGGNGDDNAGGIAVDATGSAYVVGTTTSTTFPTRSPQQPAIRGGSDVFVTKLDPTGTSVLYSTYLGGSEDDSGEGVAIDASGNAYIVGTTASTDFPTRGALQSVNRGSSDAFVVKLSADGSALLYSTYLGGSDSDTGTGIAVDASGSIYVTGSTASSDLQTVNAAQRTYGGGSFDAFVARINPTGASLAYLTYLGGSGDDFATAVATDGAGNAYITGSTSSSDFSLLAPLQGSYRGGSSGNAFVTKLNPAGSPIYSTYLGGSSGDTGLGIAADNTGDAYVSGMTSSADFPTMNAAQPALAPGSCPGTTGQPGPCADAFVAKLAPSGNALLYSTYLGGTGSDAANAIAVDGAGNVYLAGRTDSSDYPTVNALQPAFTSTCQDPLAGSAPCNHAVVTKLDSTGKTLLYSTYLGGGQDDHGVGIAVDGKGSAYVAGYTTSTNFPTLHGLQAGNAGGQDAFVAKIAEAPSATPTLTLPPTLAPTATLTPAVLPTSTPTVPAASPTAVPGLVAPTSTPGGTGLTQTGTSTPVPTATLAPVPTPTPTPMPAKAPPPGPKQSKSPTVTIDRVALFLQIPGRQAFKSSTELHLGQLGYFTAFYRTADAGSSVPMGALRIAAQGRAFFTTRMRPGTPGSRSLQAIVRFHGRQSVGRFMASFTLTLGRASATRSLPFTVKP